MDKWEYLVDLDLLCLVPEDAKECMNLRGEEGWEVMQIVGNNVWYKRIRPESIEDVLRRMANYSVKKENA